MSKHTNLMPDRRDWRRLFHLTITIGIVLALLTFGLRPRDGSEGVLVVDLNGQRCQFDNVFVGDQLIRARTTCRPIATADAPAP
ncbi:hypothetical protein [Burkholderia guangdongensis]|uniref:hypothetical protein n=1 Tax=Burkholderia guangdongensis TaxID=1792500 RepID=UPI0015C905A7|nr:hypothetical protein [Burkholderia guangdongensis]